MANAWQWNRAPQNLLLPCKPHPTRPSVSSGYPLGLSDREKLSMSNFVLSFIILKSSLSLPLRCYNIYNMGKKISKTCAQLFVSRQIKCKVIVMQMKLKEFHELLIYSTINCMFTFLSYVYYLHSGVPTQWHDFTENPVPNLLELKDKPVVVMRAGTDMSRNISVLSLSRYSVVKWCGLLSLTQSLWTMSFQTVYELFFVCLYTIHLKQLFYIYKTLFLLFLEVQWHF